LQTEETLQGVILELQKDRMSLRGHNMNERLKKLADSGPMGQFILRQRDRQEALKRYSREEQNKLEGAVEWVSGLKTKVKKEMALIKVTDLTKQNAERGEEAKRINYMVIKARHQVNEALDVLFAKDSHLNMARSLREALPATKLGKEQLKVGSLRVNGLLMPKQVISLTEGSFTALKSNLAVFAT
jgi:hypothetical protein